MATELKKHPDIVPTHPGEILREDTLPALALSVSEAAKHLGVARQTIHRILSGRAPVTAAMALRIGKLCGTGPGMWLRLQDAYDLWHVERDLRATLAKIPTLTEAA